MAKYIMALDAGTTSNRCILFNESGEMCSVSQREFPQYFPKPGWVEHDANEIWATQLGVAVEAMQKIGATAADIAAIDAGTIQSSNIKGKEELIGAVIAFKTGAKSSAGSGKVGLMKLVAIGEKIGTNANARVFTFAVKLPKE